jgi:sec-independent protein translocase protein TatA
VVGDILQPTHLLFILVVALLVLGPKRLPEVGRSLGNGLRDFRSAVSGESNERHDEIPSPVIAETAQPTPVSVETAQPVGDPAQHTT